MRELENCIERTATMAQGEVIREFGFPCKQNKCLTQTLHFLDKADAVAAVATVAMPARRRRPGAGRRGDAHRSHQPPAGRARARGAGQRRAARR